jgi:hypothetical protein
MFGVWFRIESTVKFPGMVSDLRAPHDPGPRIVPITGPTSFRKSPIQAAIDLILGLAQ